MSQSHKTKVLEGNGKFASNFFKIVSRTKENLICSPSSVHAVLAMAYQGAGGTTLKAFENILQVPNTEVTAGGYEKIMSAINEVREVTLLMANNIYVMHGYPLKTSFKTAVSKNFGSEVQAVDFSKNEESARIINDWVSVKTKDRIKDLIQASCLNSMTRIVLVNAVYFKGNWKFPFDKTMTREEPFNINKNDVMNVQMMRVKEDFMYKHDDKLKAKILKMPYVNESMSMVFVLPDQMEGLQELEVALTSLNINDVTSNLHELEVEAFVPKFKIEATLSLVDVLKEMGLSEIFDQTNANFSNIFDNSEQLYVSEVVQKAFIEVNEEGAEAAAATAMIAVYCCAVVQPKKIVFRADHPFVFYLIHHDSEGDNVLFVGHITKPMCN